MRHSQAVDLLTLYADGEVSAEKALQLEAHIADCVGCQEWLGTHAVVRHALGPQERASTRHLSSARIAAYVVQAETLTQETLHRVEAHFDSCSSCLQEVEWSREALGQDDREESAVSSAVERSPALRGHWGYRVALAASLFMLLAVGFLIVGDSSQKSYVLADEIYSGQRLVEAEGSITATSVIIETGSEVAFQAGEMVVLGEGFVVDEGATFEVEVTDNRSSNQLD